MKLLVLGGTAWLGAEVARQGVARGHDVTCLARGESGRVPDGVRFVRADRGGSDPYRELAGDAFDAVIDVATQPGHVRGAVKALASRVALYCVVSSVSVYLDHSTLGQDESAATYEPLASDVLGDLEDYGAAKRAAEVAVRDGCGAERSLIVRPGLIGGPGDRSGRVGYWPWRFANPVVADGTVLVPESGAIRAQIIDVRDLAQWLLNMVSERHAGVFNAVGESLPLGEVLAQARVVADHRGPLREASSPWLLERGVVPWMGPRSMPLWLPMAEYAGHGAHRNSAAVRSGLAMRSLHRTLADTLAWERDQPTQPHGAGLTAEEEVHLLGELSEDAGS